MFRVVGVFGWVLVLVFGMSVAVPAQIILSEIMARNSGGLLDEDGDSSDWIELYNASTSTVNLAGWSLTDEPLLPQLWIFPATNLSPGDSLLIFASDKDRRVAGAELHTNFRLSGDGEYLGLFRPDLSVASEFTPAFPPQFEDVSYGLSANATNELLVAEIDVSGRVLVPTNGLLGLDWIEPTFDDSSWTASLTGIGYDRNTTYDSLIRTDLQAEMDNQRSSAYLRIPFNVANPSALVSMTLSMKYDDGYVAYLNGQVVAERNAPASPQWDSTATGNHNDGQAVIFEPVDIVANFSTLLTPGTNVLAIHGMNRALNNSDALFVPKLEARTGEYPPGAPSVFLDVPTPGAVNSDGVLSFVGDTMFSVDRGFYNTPFITDITTRTPGATIIYTTDGSEPTRINGTQVAAADAGSAPTASVMIAETTVLRAAAFKENYGNSGIDSMTYLFVDDIVTQSVASTLAAGFPADWAGTSPDYGMDPDVVGPGDLFGGQYANSIRGDLKAIPTLSIVMNIDDMFGTTQGIYSHPTSSGSNWERPACVEWIDPNGDPGFHVRCGIRIQGGAFRNFGLTKKKSFRLLFKSEYGPGKLRYPLFGTDSGAVDFFDTLVLRMESNDGFQWGNRTDPQYARDQYLRDLALDLGLPASHGTRAHLYINGVYWGVYNPVERPDAHFAEAYFGVDDADWDGLNSGTPINDDGDAARRNRTLDAWNTLVAKAQAVANAATEAEKMDAFLHLQGRRPDGSNDPATESFLDVQNYIDYLIVNYWGGNSDWPRKNYYCGRANVPGTEGFKFFMWDAEWSILMQSPLNVNRLGDNRGVAIPFQDLRSCAEFRLQFGDRVHRAFSEGGPFHVNPMPDADPTNPTNNLMAVKYKTLTEALVSPLVAESARWGDQHGVLRTVENQWRTEQEEILTAYLPFRSGIVLQQFKDADLYPNVEAPEYNQNGGLIAPGFPLSMSAPTGTIYYTLDGSDPREAGTGAIRGTVYAGAFPLDASSMVKARTLAGGEWSALEVQSFVIFTNAPGLCITEVMYNAPDAEGVEVDLDFVSSDFDYLELQNNTGARIGLNGAFLTEGVTFDFSTGGIPFLDPGEFLLVVANRAAFETRYPGVTNIAGVYSGNLANNGERITIEVPVASNRLSVTYNDARCWPLAADGAGHSLIPLRKDARYAPEWRISQQRGGSPGRANLPPIRDVVINEFAAHTDLNHPGFPDHDSNDWIELFNLTASDMNLDDWWLSDDGAALQKWRFPAGTTLPASGRLSVDEITGFHNPITNGFGLNKAGEEIYLSHFPASGSNRVADAIEFRGQENGVTLGRFPDGDDDLMRLDPTRDADNRLTTQSVVISEIMYNPPGTNAADLEFLELFNPTGEPILLENAQGPWRINGAVEMDLPPDLVLPATGHVLLVNFNPTNFPLLDAFLTEYGLAPGPTILGPYQPSLPNGEGRVALERAQPGEDIAEPFSWVIVDEVYWTERDPWDASADGGSHALHRIAADVSGKNPTNWLAADPSPASGGPQLDNAPPMLPMLADVITDEGETVQLDFQAADPDLGQALHYSLAVAPGNTSINASGRFEWVTTEIDGPGIYTVTVVVVDNGIPARSDTQSIQITVLEVNDPPVLNALTNQTVNEGELIQFQASASDPDPGQSLTFSISDAPGGATINPTNGLFTWQTDELDGFGIYTVQVSVADNGVPSLSDTQAVVLTVREINHPPVLVAPVNQVADEGERIQFQAAATDPDPGQSLTFSISNAPGGATINPTNGLFTWQTDELDGFGIYTVQVSVADDGVPSLSDTQAVVLTVREINHPPVLVAPVNQVADEGERIQFQAEATDPDPGQSLTFSISNAPGGATINPTNGLFTWQTDELDGFGIYTVQVSVADNGVPSLSDTQAVVLTVREINHPPVIDPVMTQRVNEGETMQFMARAADPDPNQMLGFSVQNAPSGAVMQATGLFQWATTETDGPSTSMVHVVVQDSGTPSLRATTVVTLVVNEINSPPALKVPGDQLVFIGETVRFTATATDADRPAQALVFSLSPGSVGTLDADTGQYAWTPGTNAVGLHDVQVQVSDGVDTSNRVVEIQVAAPLVITNLIRIEAEGFQIRFPSVPGVNYVLEKTDDLQQAKWQEIGRIRATDFTTTLPDPDVQASLRHYRIRMEE